MDSKNISEYALEVVCTRLDKINARIVKALILTIVLLFISNAIWAYVWMQYDIEDEVTTETITLDTGEGGDANYADRGGSVVNGENNNYKSDSQEEAYQKKE